MYAIRSYYAGSIRFQRGSFKSSAALSMRNPELRASGQRSPTRMHPHCTAVGAATTAELPSYWKTEINIEVWQVDDDYGYSGDNSLTTSYNFV